MTLSHRTLNILIAAVCIVFVALRFWRLRDSCLWFDEIFSVHAAEHSWNTLPSFVALDLIHPPLFYVLLKLWIGIGGESLLWLRIFPVILSILSLIPFLLLIRELKLSNATQLIALSLLTVNGALLKYSQEVRMYSLVMCLSLFSMWLFARYFVRGKSFIPLVLVNLLLVYTHYFGWFVVGSEVTAILIFQRIKWRPILAMLAVTFASFLPWVYAVWDASHTGSGLIQNIGWMQRPGVLAITQFKFHLIEPFYYAGSSTDPISIYKVSIPLMTIVTVAVVFHIVNWKRTGDNDKTSVYFFAIFMILPVSAALLSSWLLPYSIWGTRHLIIVFAPVAVVLAIAIANIKVRRFRISSVSLLILFSGYGFVLYAGTDRPNYSWCAWETLTAEIAESETANIYAFEDLIAYHIWFAERDREPKSQILRVTNLEGIPEDKAYFLPRGFDNVKTIDFQQINESRIWIAYRARQKEEKEPPLRDFILKGYQIADQRAVDAAGEKAIFVLLQRDVDK